MPKRTDKRPPSAIQKYMRTATTAATFDDEITDFLLDRRTRQFSPKTLSWYAASLEKLRDFCLANGLTHVSDLAPRNLRLFLAHLEDVGHNVGGISNIYRAVRVWLRWYAKEHNLPSLLETLEKVPAPSLSAEPLDPIPLAHVKKMLAACSRASFPGLRDYCLILVLLDTGIRHQELTDLTLDDLNLSDGSIVIRHGKGGKRRTVFVGVRTLRVLRDYLKARNGPVMNRIRVRRGHAESNALWLTREGAPLTKHGIRQAIERRATQANIPVPGLHEFRRAFAINSLRNGMDVITLQRLLGHSTLTVINRYLKLLSDDLKAAHGKYGVVDNL